MAIKQFDQFLEPVAVAYIGNKPTKRDTVASTGVVWNGFGDVQVVDARAASLLLKHPTVWCKQDQLETIKGKLKEDVASETKQQLQQQAQQEAEKLEAEKLEAEEENQQEDTTKIDAIKSAILALDPTNTDHFAKSGQPKVSSVNMLLPDGLVADSKEIAKAFKELGGE